MNRVIINWWSPVVWSGIHLVNGRFRGSFLRSAPIGSNPKLTNHCSFRTLIWYFKNLEDSCYCQYFEGFKLHNKFWSPILFVMVYLIYDFLYKFKKFSMVSVSVRFTVVMQFGCIFTLPLDMIHCPLLFLMQFWSLNWLSSIDMGENSWSLGAGQAPRFVFCKFLIYRLGLVLMNFAFWCWWLLFNMNRATYDVWMILVVWYPIW